MRKELKFREVNIFKIPMSKIKHKTAFLTWVAIYPSITITLWAFGYWLESVPLYFRTLILTIVLVPLLSYVLLPLLTKLFAKWLSK